jgi:hypothetical protein
MACLLSLPRELRDEIIDYTLLPERVQPIIDTTAPSFWNYVAQREQKSWKDDGAATLRQVVAPFPPIRIPAHQSPNVQATNDPRRYAYPSTKPMHPFLLANHQLRAELEDSIRRHKELRQGEVTLLLVDEAIWVPIWTKYPSFRGFNAFLNLIVNIKIVTTSNNSFPRSGIGSQAHGDFSRLWEVPTATHHDTGMSAMMEAFTAVLYGLLRLWLPPSDREISDSELQHHLYAIEQLHINIENPSASDESQLLGPPLQWSMRSQGYLPTKLFIPNHALDPEWLLQHIKTALPTIIKNDLTLNLPNVPLGDDHGLARAQAQSINTVSEGLGSIFERVGKINLTYDQKLRAGDDQLDITKETLKVVQSELRNVGHWRCGGRVVDGTALAQRQWAKTVSRRHKRGLPVLNDLLVRVMEY